MLCRGPVQKIAVSRGVADTLKVGAHHEQHVLHELHRPVHRSVSAHPHQSSERLRVAQRASPRMCRYCHGMPEKRCRHFFQLAARETELSEGVTVPSGGVREVGGGECGDVAEKLGRKGE
jgi:hypothetical protein